MTSKSKGRRRMAAKSTRRKSVRRKARPTAAPDPHTNDGGGLGTANLLDTPRNLWKAGVEALSGGGLTGYPQAALQGGLKKLESVFDQRVLDALQRASMPSPEAIRDLEERVAALETLVRRLERR